MKNHPNKTAVNTTHRKYQSKIEAEECQLILALREAEKQLRCLDRSCGDEEEPGVDYEKEALVTRSNHYRQKLKTVRDSLGRIRSGSFGVCESCGDEIGEKRLAAIPTALYCLECQDAYERERASAALHA